MYFGSLVDRSHEMSVNFQMKFKWSLCLCWNFHLNSQNALILALTEHKTNNGEMAISKYQIAVEKVINGMWTLWVFFRDLLNEMFFFMFFFWFCSFVFVLASELYFLTSMLKITSTPVYSSLVQLKFSKDGRRKCCVFFSSPQHKEKKIKQLLLFFEHVYVCVLLASIVQFNAIVCSNLCCNECEFWVNRLGFFFDRKSSQKKNKWNQYSGCMFIGLAVFGFCLCVSLDFRGGFYFPSCFFLPSKPCTFILGTKKHK